MNELQIETVNGLLRGWTPLRTLALLDAGHAVQQGRPIRLSSASAGENARESHSSRLLDAAQT